MTPAFRCPVYCALDTTDLCKAMAIAAAIKPWVGGIKLGLEFFNANGPQGIARLAELGLPVFADLKMHDIPNTVAGGIRAVLPLGVSIVNVHAGGGRAMMKAAAEAAATAGPRRPKVIAVTVLTSMDASDLNETGVHGAPADQVMRLATLARDAGMDGVVCSAHEIEPLRKALGPGFMLVVPGIRPAGAETGDQKRIMTPAEALKHGADWLVIGRPITGAADPAAAARAIHDELLRSTA
jgi:orotidine-5'-phosphate decarboxylase